jgi:hypothetical protein
MRTLPNVLVSLIFVLSCGSACGDNKSIQGTVIGMDGKPLAGAEIRAERSDVKTAPAVTKTDGKGLYVFRGLASAGYTVTATVGGIPKSRAKVITQKNGWARVDFDLRKTGNAGNTSNSNPSADTLRAQDLNRAQQGLGGNINSMSFPGH